MLDRPNISKQIIRAAGEIERWLEAPVRRTPDVFKVDGYAGTGKTTLIKHVISRIGDDGVFCAALSGKAAFVMRSKGIENASTIHSLIYKTVAASADQIEKLKERIRTTPQTSANDEIVRRLKEQLRELERPSFKLNTDSKLRGARLLILDEVSMVGQKIAEDLISFGPPILVVGDPGQLPPVDGSETGFFDSIDADVTLTEPHRQEAGSPIIELATDIRLGRPWRKYGGGVAGNTIERLGSERLYAWMEKADQVICGLNRNRRKCNVEMLRRAGFDNVFPAGRGEKLICLRNDHQRGLVNGMPVALVDICDEGHDKYFSARLLVTDEEGKLTDDRGEARIYKGFFETARDGNEQRIDDDRPLLNRERLVELDWGYCITAHKAQGSEWGSVLVLDDGWGLGRKGGQEQHRRWLYTAVTRASRNVAVVRADRF